METINITAYTTDATQIEAVKAFLKALKIKFELTREKKEVSYNPEFVAKIEKSRKQAENGEVTRVEKENLKMFLGL
jgi:hypothetical protein